MSGLVAEQPAVLRVDEALAEVAAEQARYLAWVVGQRAAHDQRVEAHRRAVDDAIVAGKAPPTEEPRQPVTEQQHADRISLYRARQLTLDEERVTVVASLAPDVVTAARAEYDEALGAAREHVAALTTICAAVNAAQQAVYEVRAAEAVLDQRDPHRGGPRLQAPAKTTPETLTNAVTYNKDLLEPAVVQRRLGLDGPGFHRGVPASAWEPPTRTLGRR